MNSKRVFFVMVAVVSLLVVANFAVIVLGSQLLSSKAKNLTNNKLQSKVLDAEQTDLLQAKKDIDKYSDLNTIAKSVVPQDKDQAEAVRELVKIAGDNGVVLSSISFPASSLGLTPAQAGQNTGTTSTSGTTTAPTKAPPITQVQPVDGIPGVYTLPINIQQDSAHPVTFDKFINFLSALEHNRRTSQVTSITVNPNPGDRSKLTFSLTVQAYIKP